MAAYVDYAKYYDYDHAIDTDLAFYINYARQYGSPVLELACGTGRLLVPVAKAGFEIYGIDLSENMLSLCRRKVEKRDIGNHVHLFCADMATFDLPRKDFALAYIPVRSFMHLFTQEDQLACLRRTYDHLRPGGVFIVDVYAPSYSHLAKEQEEGFHLRREVAMPNGHRLIRRDRFLRNDPVLQIQHYEICFEEYDEAGNLINKRTLPLDTRYTFCYEMQLLLESVGFEIVDIFRDYDKNPFDGTEEIIAVARRPG
ncbi:MAG: class I SAM-dependent methyltransferase [Chloroflexi bacterium]|nr:class I SAM-dependent methyltransferase [Chloroflexota bacterium]